MSERTTNKNTDITNAIILILGQQFDTNRSSPHFNRRLNSIFESNKEIAAKFWVSYLSCVMSYTWSNLPVAL